MLDEQQPAPWHRQFWPWFLLGLPAVVVVASLITVGIAVQHADDLVADDYYKEGLAINRQLEYQHRAEVLGLSAALELDAGQVRLSLTGGSSPASVKLSLFHPMEANRDLSLKLQRTATGQYVAPIPIAVAGNWHWSIEPLSGERWELNGRLTAP